MEITERINELRSIVAGYNTESFVGFFAYFINKGTRDSLDIELNKLITDKFCYCPDMVLV